MPAFILVCKIILACLLRLVLSQAIQALPDCHTLKIAGKLHRRNSQNMPANQDHLLIRTVRRLAVCNS